MWSQDFTNTAKLNVFMELTNLTSGCWPCLCCQTDRVVVLGLLDVSLSV